MSRAASGTHIYRSALLPTGVGRVVLIQSFDLLMQFRSSIDFEKQLSMTADVCSAAVAGFSSWVHTVCTEEILCGFEHRIRFRACRRTSMYRDRSTSSSRIALRIRRVHVHAGRTQLLRCRYLQPSANCLASLITSRSCRCSISYPNLKPAPAGSSAECARSMQQQQQQQLVLQP